MRIGEELLNQLLIKIKPLSNLCNLDSTLGGIYSVWPIIFKIGDKFHAAQGTPCTALRYKGALRSRKLILINPLFSAYYTLYCCWKYRGVLLSIMRCRWDSNSVFVPRCLRKWTIYRCPWWYGKSVCCRECDLLQIQSATSLQWEINMIYLWKLTS